jgi:hypothetical protein
MKKILSWQVVLGLSLIVLSAVVYYIHYLIFHDAHHIFLYLVGDIAFVFIEVLLVTMVLHELLHHREKKSMLNKLNMVIGAFFSEVGTGLLKSLSSMDKNNIQLRKELVLTAAWSQKDFLRVSKYAKAHMCSIDAQAADLESLRSFLKDKRQFLLNLLENPNLLEHATFTDLLWAVFHLTEELLQRKRLQDLPETDYQHLSGDLKRAYNILIGEWLSYMKHLKNNYPYLFSLALRTNPFDPDASAEVK